MNIDRRRSLAAASEAQLPEVEAAVVESWPELLPTAAAWTQEKVTGARRAVRAALAALVGVLAQGDLDDETWGRIDEDVAGHGRTTPEEREELMRTVRVVGVQLLADRLRDTVGLSADERWALQAQAGWLLDRLAGTGEELDIHQGDDLLAELYREGPDAAPA